MILIKPYRCSSSTHPWTRCSAGMAKASSLGTISRVNASSWAGSFFYGSSGVLSNEPQAALANSTRPPASARCRVPAVTSCGSLWRSSMARAAIRRPRLAYRLRTASLAVPHTGARAVLESRLADRPSPTAPWCRAPGPRCERSSPTSIPLAVPSGWPRGVPAHAEPDWLDTRRRSRRSWLGLPLSASCSWLRPLPLGVADAQLSCHQIALLLTKNGITSTSAFTR